MKERTHYTCRRWALLVDAAHDLFEDDEIDLDLLKAICAARRPPCEDQGCPTCYRQRNRAGEPRRVETLTDADIDRTFTEAPATIREVREQCNDVPRVKL